MSLLTSTEKTEITGAVYSLYQTQLNSQIIVVKEPIQTIISNNSNQLYGYDGNESNSTNYAYTYVSGIYSGVVRYGKDQKQESFQESKISIPHGQVRIKVLEDCRDYILNGKTQCIEINNTKFNVITDDGVKNHFDLLKFYYFMLERTN